jgi:hypothetical protein
MSKVVFEGDVADWRIADGESATGLPEAHRAPWKARVLSNYGWGGLGIEMAGPDGRTVTIAIEVSNGDPRVMLSPSEDFDQPMIVELEAEGPRVSQDAEDTSRPTSRP